MVLKTGTVKEPKKGIDYQFSTRTKVQPVVEPMIS